MNDITRKIAEIIEWELSVENAQLTDRTLPKEDLIKSLFNNYLHRKWGCHLDSLHCVIDESGILPANFIWAGIYQAALKTAIREIDWRAIAEHESIAGELAALLSQV